MVGIKAKHFCQKLEAPFAAVLLKVIAERPAAHHLEECAVALVSDRIDIVGTNTALNVAEPCSERMLLTEEVRHQGLHTRNVEHDAR